MTTLTKALKKAAKDSRVTLVAGAFFGALTNLYAEGAVIALFVLTCFVFGVALFDHRRSMKQLAITDQERLSLLRPNPDAIKAVQGSNKNLLVVGGVVELTSHPNINTEIHAADAGWNPADILVEFMDQKFDATAIMEAAGGVKDFDPPNGKKYALVSVPFITEESPQLELHIKETDYFTIQTAKNFLQEQPHRLPEFGNVLLDRNRVPSSLCLHYVILTDEGSVLCMRRSKEMAYHGNLWSITGEEQLSDHEVGKKHPVETLFKRALCEEIFHLRNSLDPQSVLPYLEPYLRFLRIISVGIELPLYNPALFGIAQLSIGILELRDKLLERKRSITLRAGEDDEGDFFVLDKINAINLLKNGEACVTGLFSQSEEVLKEDSLHPTSRYRLFRVMRTTLGKSLGSVSEQ